MRNKITYEWTLEEVERNEDETDIIDSDFSEQLTFDKSLVLADNYDLGLVRYEGNEVNGVTDQLWAYVKNGKLPEFFSDSRYLPTSIKVPQKYHNELAKYLNP